jgi:hypothetical protein
VIVKYTDAILGGSAAVATIRGEAWLPIPPGTQDGQVLTLPGAGISPGAAAVGRDSGQAGQPRQLAAGSRQRGAHHYTVVLLLPSQVQFCCTYSPCAGCWIRKPKICWQGSHWIMINQ